MCLCAVLWDHIFSSPPNTAILCLRSCYTLKFYIPLPLHHWGSTAAQGQVFTEPKKAALRVRWGKKRLPCNQMMDRKMEEEVWGEVWERVRRLEKLEKAGHRVVPVPRTWGHVEVYLYIHPSIYLSIYPQKMVAAFHCHLCEFVCVSLCDFMSVLQ